VPLDSPDPQATYDGLREEVRRYSEALAAKPHLVILGKRDLLPAAADPPVLQAPGSAGTIAISSAAGSGLDELKEQLWRFIQDARRASGEQDGEAADGEPERQDDVVEGGDMHEEEEWIEE
jgi:GTPase involved in cell partitioning and DNA repair